MSLGVGERFGASGVASRFVGVEGLWGLRGFGVHKVSKEWSRWYRGNEHGGALRNANGKRARGLEQKDETQN